MYCISTPESFVEQGRSTNISRQGTEFNLTTTPGVEVWDSFLVERPQIPTLRKFRLKTYFLRLTYLLFNDFE